MGACPPPPSSEPPARLAALLTGAPGPLGRPARERPRVRGRGRASGPSARGTAPADVWAVDGGQALVADARCLQLLVTRAARVRFRDGSCVRGGRGRAAGRAARRRRGATAALAGARRRRPRPPTPPSTSTSCATGGSGTRSQRSVDEAEPGALVLVDGDLQPDWRIPSACLADLLDRAAERGVTRRRPSPSTPRCPGAARRCSGSLELEAEADARRPRPCGGRRWPAPGPTSAAACRSWPPGSTPTPASPSASTCPPTPTPRPRSARSPALCDDAAFPGYPYPLSRRRPAGRLPGLAAGQTCASSSTTCFDRRRRARSTCASGPSPTATR